MFQPQCLQHQVVVIESARYGHIELGRCVDADFGHLGCVHDELKYLDQQCSGKPSCSITVTNSIMGNDLPCAAALARYLESSFACQLGKSMITQTINSASFIYLQHIFCSQCNMLLLILWMVSTVSNM